MIPESEWKFFEATEQRIRHLERHRAQNDLAAHAGRELPFDPAELADRYAALLHEMDYPARIEQALAMDPTPGQARQLDLHRRWVLRTLFETHPDLAPLIHELRRRLIAFRPEMDGRPATRAEIHRVLTQEPGRDRRESAYRAMVPLAESVKEDLAELFRRRERLARAVAGTGFAPLAFHVLEQERAEVLGLVDEFERFTRNAYRSARKEIGRSLGIHDVEPWDVPYGLAQLSPFPADVFPEDRALSEARAQAERWGLSLDARFDPADPPTASLVFPPDEDPARVLHQVRTGLDAFRMIFHAAGHVIRDRAVLERRHLLTRESPAVTEAFATVFEEVTGDPGWLQAFTGAPGPAVRAHLRAVRLARIATLRRHAVLTTFESLVYAQSDLDPHRLHADAQENLLMETRRPEPLWAADLEIITDPFHHASAILGAMAAAQIRERLAAEFPEAWKDPRAGAWLQDRLLAGGADRPWTEKVEAATGKPLGMEALAAELDVTFSGPELEDEEEAGLSDDAVAEYYRDIDLSDLDLE